MRWLVALLFLLPSAAALLEDPAGDVVISHCQAAETPLAAFDPVDLLALEVTEDPTHVTFRVQAVGIRDQADLDSSNYFVHFKRGEQHWALRMAQDNQGTAAIAHLLATEGVSLFGPIIAEYVADVDGETGTIQASVERNQLRDHEQAPLTRGQTIDQIIVSAEAHATGVYFCDFEGSGGPAIIQDHMPDGWIDDGVSIEMIYGGADTQGPMDLFIPRPFRGSNGEATTYAFDIQVTNLADDVQIYNLETSAPDGWTLHLPNGTLRVEAGQEATFTMYAEVPFIHTHGATATGRIDLRSDLSSGGADFGVHYLDVPQPAGHHPDVYIHSIVPSAFGGEINERAGGGDNHMFWNTQEDHSANHDVPMSGQTEEGDIVWYGCLTPGLAMGLHPDSSLTGAYNLDLASEFATTGTLTGSISLLPDDHRPSTCHNAGPWQSTPLLALDATDVNLDGPGTVTGTISVLADGPMAFQPGADLLLTIRLQPDQSPTLGGTVDLLPGSRLTLPLRDYHEPAPTLEAAGEHDQFQAEPEPPGEDSPAAALLLPLALAAWVARRLK
ncbi:MAG: hypothetical protein ACPHID_05105 [Thermoplasmatota archaeon]